MVAGIVLVALGIKKTLDHVGDPLGVVSAALCGGVALYLRAHNAFRLRDVGSVSVQQRLAATAVSLALILAAVRVPALLILAATATILVALASYETSHSDEPRRKTRVR